MTLDELDQIGMERLDEAQIRDVLASQGVGVLGLAADDDPNPYLLPLSFGFDGDSQLYFVYLYGDESRKRALSEQVETAQFLVYEAASPLEWQSVQLTGTLHEVPADEWDDIESALENAWHPALLEDARYTTDVTLYRFRIEEQSGVAHSGLPAEHADDDRRE